MDAANLNASQWQEWLDAFPPACRDVYFTPAYHEAHVIEGAVPAAAGFSEGSRRLLVPGVRMPVEGGRFDMQSSNGYGGPLASPEADAAFLERAWEAWRQEARRAGVLAVFFRLHPLLGNRRWLPEGAQLRRDRQTVAVSLEDGVDAAFRQAGSSHRNMVSKGRRSGVRVVWDDPDAWGGFEALYSQAMERLDAPAALRFGPACFAGLRRLPGSALAAVYDSSGLAAAAVFLSGPCWMHYHLSARRPDADNCLTNCLIQSALERAAAAGLKGMHLGGGRSTAPDDALFRFKRSLGGRLLEFEVAMVVADEPEYAARCAVWTRAAGRPPDWMLGYRQPLPSARPTSLPSLP